MATYYRWEKSHIEYAAVSTEISGAVRESGNYDPSKSPCGYVWHSDSITVTADKITLNNPTRTNLSANVYGTVVGGYCMCTPLSVTTAPSFDYVYKSSGGDEQTFFRGEYGFAQVQGSTFGNPSTLYKVTPSGATQGSFIEYIYSESPNAYPQDGVSGNYWYSDRTAITVSPPSSISVSPHPPKGGSNVSVSWGAASSGGGAISNYELSKRLDGGSWSQRYKGSGRSYADTVPFGTESVRYRVKAYDGENLSSGYTTSPTRSVVNAPDVPVLTVPELAMEGQTVPVSWTAATHAAGYTLERKASTDADWTQVYSGQALSSSETAGAWTAVQYRVKATGEEADSAWATSGEIPVVSASALVISGQDGDLGTLVNDVPYSVSSDTGNQISLELRVNGALWTALEVSSGYAQSIPVIDLPTGAGTIDILATVQASTGAVSAARAWTYTKTPVTTSAGPCDVVEWQDATGAVKFPVTLAEAVRIPGGMTLDQVIQFPAQICTGSYVGTGTYGKDDPTEITFPFVPDLWGYFANVQIGASGSNYSSSMFSSIPWGLDIPNKIQVLTGLGGATNMQFDGKTVKFYGDDVNGNANAKGITYWYYAVKIG